MPLDFPSATPQPDRAIADARSAERRVVHGYVPADRREGFAAVLALDAVLARIVRTTREPMVGQMRLTWWYEALESLDDGSSPVGEPVLTALANEVVPRGVSGRALATMIDAWEMLLAPEPIDRVGFGTLAAARGSVLFTALAAVLGGRVDSVTVRAGEGWALADLAAHLTDRAQADLAGRMAAETFDGVFDAAWPRSVRPLGMLALLARADIVATSSRPGSPRRLARLLMHRIWRR